MREKPPGSLTPNTRKRKRRLAQDFASHIKQLNISNTEDQIYVTKLSLQNLSIHDKIQHVRSQVKLKGNHLEVLSGNFGMIGALSDTYLMSCQN